MGDVGYSEIKKTKQFQFIFTVNTLNQNQRPYPYRDLISARFSLLATLGLM